MDLLTVSAFPFDNMKSEVISCQSCDYSNCHNLSFQNEEPRFKQYDDMTPLHVDTGLQYEIDETLINGDPWEPALILCDSYHLNNSSPVTLHNETAYFNQDFQSTLHRYSKIENLSDANLSYQQHDVPSSEDSDSEYSDDSLSNDGETILNQSEFDIFGEPEAKYLVELENLLNNINLDHVTDNEEKQNSNLPAIESWCFDSTSRELKTPGGQHIS